MTSSRARSIRPYENYLLLGRVDAVPGYLDAEVPELEAKAGGPGSLSILQGSDFGYTVYGSGLFTSEKMIAEHSDLVQRFVNAYAAPSPMSSRIPTRRSTSRSRTIPNTRKRRTCSLRKSKPTSSILSSARRQRPTVSAG